MSSFSLIFSTWMRRVIKEIVLIMIPGLAALLMLDINFSVFRGEFSIDDLVNFNTLVIYYVDKLDLTGQQQVPYSVVMFFVVYFLGYFLHSSSKYFVGPKRFRIFLSVKEAEDEITMSIPPSAKNFLKAQEGDIPDGAGAETCMALIDASGIPSQVSSFENRAGFYRSIGYLFFLLILIDLGLFIVAFDYSSIIMKLSMFLMNIVFSFLFFKGQEETSVRWKEQMSAETLVAVNRLSNR